MPEQVTFIQGGAHTDDRGTLRFVNDFSFHNIERFYQIINADASVPRAWQGHRIEHKYFHVPYGRYLLAWVAIDDWENPSASLQASYRILSAEEPGILSVPKGYANGIKALSPGAVLNIFSDTALAEAIEDRWTFDKNLWLDWNQF